MNSLMRQGISRKTCGHQVVSSQPGAGVFSADILTLGQPSCAGCGDAALGWLTVSRRTEEPRSRYFCRIIIFSNHAVTIRLAGAPMHRTECGVLRESIGGKDLV